MSATVEIHGFCDERFQPLRDALVANFADGYEVGASLAVLLHGESVLDIWAGHTDASRTRPWERDTIAPVASVTKIATALCMLMVIDRGLVDLDERVATYWPEFAQAGKRHVTVRDALSHCAGVPGLDPPVPLETMQDWAGITARIAAEPHWFGGERQFRYHYSIYGHILGEIIRRVDGRRPQRFFREEVALPGGIDFQIGPRSDAERDRVARVSRFGQPSPFTDPTYLRVVATISPPVDHGSWEYLCVGSPSGGGLSNGRGIARLAAIFANGGVLDGRRYIAKALVDEASSEQVFAHDPVLGAMRMGLGFGLDNELWPAPAPTSFHWGGNGGALILADQSVGLSFGYAINNFCVGGEDLRFRRLWGALGEVIASIR
jgi:CubicO group peptidase (beta-lactamase class C family)